MIYGDIYRDWWEILRWIEAPLSKAKIRHQYCATWKRCEIGCKLVLFSNRLWYMNFWLVPTSVTLNDLEGRTWPSTRDMSAVAELLVTATELVTTERSIEVCITTFQSWQASCRGESRHVQHVRPNRAPTKRGPNKSTIFSFFATW